MPKDSPLFAGREDYHVVVSEHDKGVNDLVALHATSGFARSKGHSPMTSRSLIAATLCASIAAVIVAMPTPRVDAFDQHLCGMNGTPLNAQESCPGISPRHHWKRVTGYRNDSSGIDMCVVIRDKDNKALFSRCSSYDTSIYLDPANMNHGKQLTRAYNKNNNVAVSWKELRWLYANTK